MINDRTPEQVRAYARALAEAFNTDTGGRLIATLKDRTEAEIENNMPAARLDVLTMIEPETHVELTIRANVYGHAGRYWFHAGGWPTDDRGRQIYAADVASYEERQARAWTSEITIRLDRAEDLPRTVRELWRRLLEPITPWMQRAHERAGRAHAYAAGVRAAVAQVIELTGGRELAHGEPGRLYTDAAYPWARRELAVSLDDDGTPRVRGEFSFTLDELRALSAALTPCPSCGELGTIQVPRGSADASCGACGHVVDPLGAAAEQERARDLDADNLMDAQRAGDFDQDDDAGSGAREGIYDDGPQDTRDL